MSEIETFIYKTIEESIAAKKEFYNTHLSKVIDVAKLFSETFQKGGKVLIFGNGGSASDAQHMAGEMVGRMLHERKVHLPAIALTTDSTILTAVANDYSYDDIFDFQVKALGNPGDIAVGISTSGNSKNVLKAFESARARKMTTVSFTGGSGGKLKELSHLNLNVALGKNASMTQETHITLVHLVVDVMDRFLLPPDFVVKKV